MKVGLTTPITQIVAISAPYQKRLAILGIATLRDLIFYFPRRYEDYSTILPIASLGADKTASVHGIVRTIKNRRSWKTKRFITDAIIEDETGSIPIVWFNQPYLTKNVKPGARIALAGKPTQDEKGRLSFISPEFELIRQEFLHTSRFVPIYPETARLSSKWLRWKIHSFLPLIEHELEEELPQELLRRFDLTPLKKALWQVHFPASSAQAQQARLRFSFGELLKVRLRVLKEREARKHEVGSAIPFEEEFVKTLVTSFGFSLTQDQRKATWDILKDLQKPYPMQRLLEGDVGTGKTLVALIACAQVAHHGKQAALLAPTEILASQHFETFVNLLSRFEIPVGMLTRSMVKLYDPLVAHIRKLSPSEMKEKISSGEIKIVIGTHTLIKSETSSKFEILNSKFLFKNLALVIIDEQHRFGVAQRSHLLHSSGAHPHLLSMSATPIPRSLALMLYGNLDVSLLRAFPQGERKILTRVVTPLKRSAAYEFIREKLRQGQQIYVICPVIEESEKLDTKAAQEEYEKLRSTVFPEFSCGLLHGRMKAKEKEDVMTKFFKKEIMLLVATSVVEVGVDVPGASIMVVEGAERFGLSQIHQLRGRIGRRGQVGYCLLFTNSKSRATAARLRALAMSNDGFFLAQKDLEIRGPGQLLGTRQAGISDIGMEALGNSELLETVKNEADKLLAQSPDLSAYPLLASQVKHLYGTLHME